MQHYEKPHNRGKLPNFTVHKHEENSSCGDSIDIYLKISGNKVEDASFEGIGCVISMGSASMTTDFIKGKSIDEISKMDAKTVIRVIGIDPGAARLHCATLAMRAIKEAIFDYEGKQPDAATKEL